MSAVAARPATLGTNARLALVGDAAAKAAQLAVLVLAAHLLPTSEVARLGVGLSIVTILTALFDAGVSTALVRDCAREPSLAWPYAVASFRRRAVPVTLAALAVMVAGLVWGRPADGLAIAALSIAGAVVLTGCAVFRAGQALVVEARQKLAAAGIALVAAIALAADAHSAAAVLLALFAGQVATVPFLVRRGQVSAAAVEVESSLRRALPLGALALATIAYYRAPMLILAATGRADDTASYTLASTVAFGLLMVPNAITTALLPRISAEPERATVARALARTLQLWAGLTILAAAAATTLMPAVFGAKYAGATWPFVLLMLAGFPIAASGVIGTVLVARGDVRPLLVQVGSTLVLNVVLGLVVVPRFGTAGAAVDTIVTETAATVLLARAAPDVLRLPRFLALPALSLTTLGGLGALCGFAAGTGYGLRVVSDTPTFLALIRDMALRPFAPISPFLASSSAGEAHSSPYTQFLAWAWGVVGSPARLEPAALGRFLGIAGVVVMFAVLHAVFVFARREAGVEAAWVAPLVLLVLFGPAHVIWAGDLTFNGFLYGAYFPQTLGTALALYSLLLLDGSPTVGRLAVGSVVVALTLVVHPFTGVLLAVLIAVRATLRAARRDERWLVGPVCLSVGFTLGLLWPSYSLDAAMGETGVPGHELVAALAVLPWIVSLLPRFELPIAHLAPLQRLATPLAWLGGLGVLALAAWECFLFTQRNPNPLIHSNHLSLYWVEDRWRWPLMFAAGAIGLVGLVRLALRDRLLPLLWFAGCFAYGAAGAAGMQLPLWWRFLLFCQVPLALGTAVALVDLRQGTTVRRVVVATLVFSAAFKLVTLTQLSPRIRYLDTPLQQSYQLGEAVPPGSGLVASDPYTSYFIPGTTGRQVLVVTKAHVGSAGELAAATRGYALMHQFAAGRSWWRAAQEMYRLGVRYVVVEKSTSLLAPDLVTFSTGPTPLVQTARDRRWLGTYFYRNNRVGTLTYDVWPYAVYTLDAKKLFR